MSMTKSLSKYETKTGISARWLLGINRKCLQPYILQPDRSKTLSCIQMSPLFERNDVTCGPSVNKTRHFLSTDWVSSKFIFLFIQNVFIDQTLISDWKKLVIRISTVFSLGYFKYSVCMYSNYIYKRCKSYWQQYVHTWDHNNQWCHGTLQIEEQMQNEKVSGLSRNRTMYTIISASFVTKPWLVSHFHLCKFPTSSRRYVRNKRMALPLSIVILLPFLSVYFECWIPFKMKILTTAILLLC